MEELERLGLTRLQSSAYVALLKADGLTVQQLSTALDVGRVTCYDTLKRLMDKGLVSFENRRKHRVYRAADSSRLLVSAREQMEAAELAVQRLGTLKRTEEPKSMVYASLEGMKTFFDSMLSCKEIRVIGATGAALRRMKQYFAGWERARIRKGISLRVLCNDDMRGTEESAMKRATVRYLPPEHSTPATTFIFGDNVGVLLWEDRPTAFVINSARVAESYRKHFAVVWRVGKP